ncbi:hypothetical protein ACFZC5_19105 [Nocardia gamkensis]|uniref:hypothetical protein n=1 Tax=Nocardia gamkensis TaxID=352869 RepID=UPI0036EF53DA
MLDMRSSNMLVDRGCSPRLKSAACTSWSRTVNTSSFVRTLFAEKLNSLDPLDPASVRAHAEFIADIVVAGLRARGA